MAVSCLKYKASSHTTNDMKLATVKTFTKKMATILLMDNGIILTFKRCYRRLQNAIDYDKRGEVGNIEKGD